MIPRNLTKVHVERANIPQDYWDIGFSNFQGPEKPRELTKTYLKQLAVMKENGVGILYVGPPGPGKTTLAMICMKYLSAAGWDVFCTSLGEIVERIQKSWQAGSDERGEEFLERARNADFLFIDDVGKEHRGGSGFVQTVFDNLIRNRVQHRRPTFLTTNHTKQQLESIYGDSIMSLLEGKLLPVTVTGNDFRKTNLKPDVKELFNAD